MKLRAGPTRQFNVNADVLKRNAANATEEPAIAIKEEGVAGLRLVKGVVIDGPSRLVQQGSSVRLYSEAAVEIE